MKKCLHCGKRLGGSKTKYCNKSCKHKNYYKIHKKKYFEKYKKRSFNPRLSTLIHALKTIKENEPMLMDQIFAVQHLGYKWLWGFRDKLGLIRIERGKKDRRIHLVWITKKGERLLDLLEEIQKADIIFCVICKKEIDKFYRINEDKWRKVTGKLHNQVICKKCFKKKEMS